MLIYVGSCVCASGSSLSRAINIHLSRSESNQRAIREQSESYSRSLKYCVLFDPVSLVTALTLRHYSPHSQMSPQTLKLQPGTHGGDSDPWWPSVDTRNSPHSGDWGHRWPGRGMSVDVTMCHGGLRSLVSPAPALMLCYRLLPDECGTQCDSGVWPVCECECGHTPHTRTPDPTRRHHRPQWAHHGHHMRWWPDQVTRGVTEIHRPIISSWERNVFWE